MATRKTGSGASKGAGKSAGGNRSAAKATVGGARKGPRSVGDAVSRQKDATQDLAAAFPNNAAWTMQSGALTGTGSRHAGILP